MDAYEEFGADMVIAEANQGGDMVKAVLTQEKQFVPIRLVHASRSKRARADPAAALYERGLVHHAGRFPDLEDQMCQFDGTGASPTAWTRWSGRSPISSRNPAEPTRKCESSKFKLSCHPRICGGPS